MVRLSSEPPFGRHNLELPFDERYIDVPAANIAVSAQSYIPLQKESPPLVVPVDKSYSQSGDGVVSTRTEAHVGYNAYRFRRTRDFLRLQAIPPE